MAPAFCRIPFGFLTYCEGTQKRASNDDHCVLAGHLEAGGPSDSLKLRKVSKGNKNT